MAGPNERALNSTLRALKRSGRLSKADDAMVVALKSMARQFDDPDVATTAALMRVYTDALRELTADEPDDAGSDTIARIRAVPSAPRNEASA